jgi:hypothetical protein
LVCGLDDVDVCAIDSEDISIGKTIYLGVFCSDDCSYSLRITYLSENILYSEEE